MEAIVEQLGTFAPILISGIKAAVFLLVGYAAAAFAARLVRRRVQLSERLDDTLGGFFASIVRWLILAVVLIAVLQVFGFQATSLVAVLGAASLAVGLALQGTLSNMAAGVMLILFRPYKLGDYVDIGGTAGTVQDLNLFITELVTPDNVQILVPNGSAWGAIITNYSAHDTRRLDLTFSIGYGDDMDQAMDIVRRTAVADARVLEDPQPWVRVVSLGESSVDLQARLWCVGSDYWELKFELTKQVKQAFDQTGITIPYPHRVAIQQQA